MIDQADGASPAGSLPLGTRLAISSNLHAAAIHEFQAALLRGNASEIDSARQKVMDTYSANFDLVTEQAKANYGI